MVEDHPYDYRNFEGIIPKGQYGGGTVIVWDEGTMNRLRRMVQKKKGKNFIETIKSGSLKIKMHGEKMKGEYALVKLKMQKIIHGY